MNTLALYQAIYKRKSTRKYDLTPLDDHMVEEIRTYLATVKPLYPDIKTEFLFAVPQEVTSLLPVRAPHYIVAFSESKAGYLPNMGYMLQQIDLYLSARGLGSCWLGIPRPTKAIRSSSPLEFVIIMSFGQGLLPVHRESKDEFKRKPLTAITNSTSLDELLEAVRLSPSATNSQPWFFTGTEQEIHAYCVVTNPIKALIYKKMNQIDMGIALYHLELAAWHQGKTVRFAENESGARMTPSGYSYTLSALMGDKADKDGKGEQLC